MKDEKKLRENNCRPNRNFTLKKMKFTRANYFTEFEYYRLLQSIEILDRISYYLYPVQPYHTVCLLLLIFIMCLFKESRTCIPDIHIIVMVESKIPTPWLLKSYQYRCRGDNQHSRRLNLQPSSEEKSNLNGSRDSCI